MGGDNSIFNKIRKGKSADIDNAAASGGGARRALTTAANQTGASGLNRMTAEALNLPAMDDTAINTAVGRFLKSASVSAHREIEKVVRKALASGAVREGETLTIGVTLKNEKLNLDVTIFNRIDL